MTEPELFNTNCGQPHNQVAHTMLLGIGWGFGKHPFNQQATNFLNGLLCQWPRPRWYTENFFALLFSVRETFCTVQGALWSPAPGDQMEFSLPGIIST